MIKERCGRGEATEATHDLHEHRYSIKTNHQSPYKR
jgi:hypothetical protein